MSTPDTSIEIYSGVPLDNTYRNVIKGGVSRNSLRSYRRAWWSGQTYSRITGLKGNKVRVYTMTEYNDDYFDCNYISVNNKGAKTFYGFISNIVYINDNVMEIEYEIDVFNTFYSDYSFCPCFVERATPDKEASTGYFSLPDYIENGEYDTLYTNDWRPCGQDLDLVLYFAPTKGREYQTGDLNDCGFMSGFVTGCQIYSVNARTQGGGSEQALLTTLQNYYRKGLQCIIATIMPHTLFTTDTQAFTTDLQSSQISNINTHITNLNSSILNGVTVKNKKTLTYPYTYLEVSNNMDDVKQYAFEGWNYNTPSFTCYATSLPQPTITIAPTYYFGKDIDFDNSVSISNFPNIPVQGDTIASWVSQNSTSSAIKSLGTVATGAISGALIGGGAGAIIGGTLGAIGGVADYWSNFNKANKSPSSMTNMSGANSMLLLPVNKLGGFTFRAKSLREQNVRSIDDFFTRYGVAENRLETPPFARTVSGHYHYIKTKGCTIKCDTSKGIPAWGERLICDIHDNGVTYWDRLADVGNYS